MPSNCDYCMNYAYDDEYECYMCMVNMDEDEVASMHFRGRKDCPYFRMGDEYTIVRKQN